MPFLTGRGRCFAVLLGVGAAVALAAAANCTAPEIVFGEAGAGTGGESGSAAGPSQAGSTTTGGMGGGGDGGTGGGAESCDFAGAGGGPPAPLSPEACCTENEHCISGSCVSNVCECSVFNGVCTEDSDCCGLNCTPARLCGPGIKDTPCGVNEDCLSFRCSHTCQIGEVDDPCRTDSDCRQENCDLETGNCAKARAGWDSCTSEDECLSGDCYNPAYTCFLGAADTPCSDHTDCMSGSCTPDPDCTTETCNKYCDAPALVVETMRGSANDRFLDVRFRIENTGSDAVRMSDLTVFYFYTSESAEDQVHHATLADGNLDAPDDIVSYFVTGFGGALDYALRASFTGSVVLAAGASTGEIYLQAQTLSAEIYNQNDDFSHPVRSDVTDWVGAEFNANARTVLCRRVSGIWQQVWGNSHPDFPDPCSTR